MSKTSSIYTIKTIIPNGTSKYKMSYISSNIKKLSKPTLKHFYAKL